MNNNEIKTAFDEIHAPNQLINNTLTYLDTKRIEYTENSNSTSYTHNNHKTLILAASFVVLFIVALYSVYLKPIAYVSIDVNPSIEISLNRFDKVISATAYNADGEKILSSINIRGKSYSNAINDIINSELENKYITDESNLTFTIASDTKEKENEIKTCINNSTNCKKYNGTSTTADLDSISDAHNYGLSFGKYKAYLELHECNSDISIEDCKKMTMAQIKSLISQYNRIPYNDNGHNGNAYNEDCNNTNNNCKDPSKNQDCSSNNNYNVNSNRNHETNKQMHGQNNEVTN